MGPGNTAGVVLLTGLLMAACSPEPPAEPAKEPTAAERPAPDPWDEARSRGIDFRALGQEPGWFLEIEDGESMHLVYDYMEREAKTPAPARAQEGTATVYRGMAGDRTVTVSITEQPCQDVMSGFEFPSTVTVELDGRTLHGCGRRLVGDH